jgi:hypothetical protein
VDKVLVRWEAKGYPKSREEKVQGAKNANSTNKSGSAKGSSHPVEQAGYTDADRAAAERVRIRKAERICVP